MLKKILIANRGEIAVRIIRACKELNIKTVAIYSEADKDALHTKLADEAVCVGPAPSAKSYLNIQNILEAACTTNCDGIHPGFGFLSENAGFAKMCEESNLKFIGPSYKVIDMMGNKSNSKELMKNAKVPVVPGSDGCIQTCKEALKYAEKIGYPVLLKASAGGGGKGIRKVEKPEEMEDAFNLVKQEAKAAFKDDEIYIEKFIVNPRHVEIQILADEYGNVVHLGERDCSIQRRNQKVLEESPSMILNDELREKMGKAAIRAVKASGYSNAGTIEFLVDKDSAVLWRGGMASNALKQLIGEADWGALDYFVIDMPPGTSDIHLTLVQTLAITGAIVVTTPQEVALADARKGISMFQSDKVNVPVLGIVENMSWFTPAEHPDEKYHIFGNGGGARLSEKLQVPLLAQIPLVASICDGGDNGIPSALQNTVSGAAFAMLADRVVESVDKRNATLPPTQKVEIKH